MGMTLIVDCCGNGAWHEHDYESHRRLEHTHQQTAAAMWASENLTDFNSTIDSVRRFALTKSPRRQRAIECIEPHLQLL